MDDITLTMEGQEVGDVVPKDNNDTRKILSQLNHELQEFEEMFKENIIHRETDFQPPTWSTCEVQTQALSTCEVQTQTQAWSTCEDQTQTDSWSTCEVQTQTEDQLDSENLHEECESVVRSMRVKEAEFKAELELAREKLAKKETEHQEVCEKLMQLQSLNHSLEKDLEQANDNSRKHESERQEACEKLKDLQLLHKKELKENCSAEKKIEMLEHQLHQFEDIKEEYTWCVEQNQSLEKELEQAKETSQKHEAEHKEACEKLKDLQLLHKKELKDIQEFEGFKEEFSWFARRNQSREKELQLLQEMKVETQCKDQVSVGKKIQSSAEKKIEMLEHQLHQFEDIKEEYTWCVEQNQSLEKELEQAKETSRKHEAEHKEACEKLKDLQLLHKKELKDNFEELRFLKQSLEEQVSVGKSLEKQISENAKESQKVEMLERQLQEFEGFREEFSWFARRNHSREKELQLFQEMKVETQCEDQVSVGKKIQSLADKKIEMHQRHQFEDIKEEYTWCVEQQNQSLEKELEQAKETSRKHEAERQEACEKLKDLQLLHKKELKENCSADKKIEMLKHQLHQFEDIKEEYTLCVEQENQSLEKELEQAKETSQKHEAEHKEACEKLMELKLVPKKMLKDQLEKLTVFKVCFKEQIEARRRLEQQVSEVVPQEKPSMCETQIQTVASAETLTDLKAVKVETSTSNVQTQNLVQTALFEKPQTSADESRPQSWEDDCTELKGNVKKLTQLFESKLEQDTEKQGPELKRNRVKGKSVSALMKKFEF